MEPINIFYRFSTNQQINKVAIIYTYNVYIKKNIYIDTSHIFCYELLIFLKFFKFYTFLY